MREADLTPVEIESVTESIYRVEQGSVDPVQALWRLENGGLGAVTRGELVCQLGREGASSPG